MTDSDNVELKKRSRRRLVGAAALALLAAIVLPMVMDQEPNTPSQDIQVTIPDREADSALSRPIASRSAQAEPQLAPPPEEQAPGPVPPDAVRPTTPEAAPVPPAPPAPAVAPSSKAVAGSTATESPKVPPSTGKETDANRAQAILDGKTAAVATPAGGDAFIVQIGAFGDVGKAASIAADLKKRGFAAYTEKVGAMTRVRIGPFRGRDDAEKAAQRVRASGMNGSVMPR